MRPWCKALGKAAPLSHHQLAAIPQTGDLGYPRHHERPTKKDSTNQPGWLALWSDALAG
jgi:hypothetical protein